MEEKKSHTKNERSLPDHEEQELWFSALAADDSCAYNVDKAFDRFVSRAQQKRRTVFNIPKIVYGAAAVILLLIASTISYWWGERQLQNQFADILVEAPLGAKTKLILSDSTLVWLNAGSKIVYSQGFGVKDRHLRLNGEAYFEVAKDSLNRFVVQAGDLAVEALGTSFNVKAYEEDNQAVVTLFQGKVKTSVGRDEAFLLPDQAVTYLKNKGQLKKSTLNDAYRACLWRNNELAFNDEALSEIAVLLNRMYNIQVVFKSEKVKALRFTGVITNNSLDNIIELISLTSPIIYTSKGDTIIIDEKK